ncbi:MAG: DegT/DnrJ/EryC1/StrS family aminotransferase [Gammaproteobacteria bacterium]|nr:DegT/DnrJ/EryC1/StrS family aminotransferase [Gammaproteobacteria bacterium]MCH9743471.1 DegT/DnrJ/EryC1/StrS family aminotransferase [Gammaproteobacteria bacterium]
MVTISKEKANVKKLWRVGGDELTYVKKAIVNGLTGKYINLFEEKFNNLVGSKYAIAVNSGTSALHAAMLALGVGPGDEVIVPPLTFIATAYAPIYVGATPIFADVDERTFTIDPKSIEEKITEKTKAIITVSLYGLIPEMDRIVELARERNLLLIEDNAQCVLGKYKGRGESSFGDISIYSFQRSKHLTSGDGGVVVTNNADYAEKVRKYSDLGYRLLGAESATNENFKDQIQQPSFKRHELIGYNFRMPEVCAAMGIAQLDKAEKLVELRKKIGYGYDEVIQEFDWVVSQHVPSHIEPTYWTYAFMLDTGDINWEDFRKIFIRKGGKAFYGAWSLSYLEPSFLSYKKDAAMHSLQDSCPVAEKIQPKIIQLKTNFEDNDSLEIQQVVLRDTLEYFR